MIEKIIKDLYPDSSLVKDTSYDNDACHILQIKYLDSRENSTDFHLGILMMHSLINFPEQLPCKYLKIVFMGTLLQYNGNHYSGRFYPAIIVEKSNNKNKVRISYLLEGCEKTSDYYKVSL